MINGRKVTILITFHTAMERENISTKWPNCSRISKSNFKPLSLQLTTYMLYLAKKLDHLLCMCNGLFAPLSFRHPDQPLLTTIVAITQKISPPQAIIKNLQVVHLFWNTFFAAIWSPKELNFSSIEDNKESLPSLK